MTCLQTSGNWKREQLYKQLHFSLMAWSCWALPGLVTSRSHEHLALKLPPELPAVPGGKAGPFQEGCLSCLPFASHGMGWQGHREAHGVAPQSVCQCAHEFPSWSCWPPARSAQEPLLQLANLCPVLFSRLLGIQAEHPRIFGRLHYLVHAASAGREKLHS